MNENSLRAREIMTAVVNDEYDLARSLISEMLDKDKDDARQTIEGVFQLNRFIMQWWAEENETPLPTLWALFSEYLALHEPMEE